MVKIDPLQDLEFLREIDSRALGRLHAMHSAVRSLYETLQRETSHVAHYPETGKEFHASATSFCSELETQLKEVLARYISPQTIDNFYAKSKVHFHAVPERYTRAGIDDMLREDTRKFMTSFDTYMTNTVEPALNMARELDRLQPRLDPADGLVTTIVDVYLLLLKYTKAVMNTAKKASQELVNADFKDDEILEKKLAGAASVKAIAKRLQERDFIYFITESGRISWGRFIDLQGWFGKELHYSPDPVPSYDCRGYGFERRVPLKNIFFLERVSTRAQTPVQKL